MFRKKQGILGVSAVQENYFYVKDSTNNVIAVLGNKGIAARYSYDAWGNCKIVKNEYDIATLNPIRWKSLYYDEESKFYYINGRYYSPEIKRYLSPMNPETAITNAAQIYGLNLYLLTLTNPIEMLYNEYGIGTGIELTGIVPELDDWALFERWWEKFWNSTAGKVLGIGLLVAATVLAAVCPAFMPMYKAALVVTGLSLAIGGVIAGFRSVANGEPYWDGFSDYLNDNWSQTVALEMGTSMLLFGISSAANAVYKAWSARKAQIIARASAISQDAAMTKAIELQPKRKDGNPYIVSAAYDVKTGEIYYDINGEISGAIHKSLQKKMPPTSLESWTVSNCAEFKAVNQALKAGSKMKNLVVATIRIPSLTPKKMCLNCQITMSGVLLVVYG